MPLSTRINHHCTIVWDKTLWLWAPCSAVFLGDVCSHIGTWADCSSNWRIGSLRVLWQKNLRWRSITMLERKGNALSLPWLPRLIYDERMEVTMAVNLASVPCTENISVLSRISNLYCLYCWLLAWDWSVSSGVSWCSYFEVPSLHTVGSTRGRPSDLCFLWSQLVFVLRGPFPSHCR